MLSAATRVAGGLMRSLVAVIFGAAGTVLGAVVGLLTGFINESGLMQGALIGAISGAFVSMELADSIVRIWCRDECSMDTRIKRKRLLLRSLVANRLLRSSVFPTISRALDSQIDALQPQFGRGERGDIFEPSYPVMVVGRAAVENLPVTKLTKETAGAGHQTTCPICLHVSTLNSYTARLGLSLFCLLHVYSFKLTRCCSCLRSSKPVRALGGCLLVATFSIWCASIAGSWGMPSARCAVMPSTSCNCLGVAGEQTKET